MEDYDPIPPNDYLVLYFGLAVLVLIMMIVFIVRLYVNF
jgi:hypothetical protein